MGSSQFANSHFAVMAFIRIWRARGEMGSDVIKDLKHMIKDTTGKAKVAKNNYSRSRMGASRPKT